MKNLKQLMLVIISLISFSLHVSADVYTDEFGTKYEYRIINGNEVEITKASPSSSSTGGYARIPDYISGLLVTSIGESAFASTSFNEVVLPGSLKSIGAYAFEHTYLTSVELPPQLTEISEGCFSYCRKLTSVKISESVKTIGCEAFHCCSSLRSVNIPDGITLIDDYAFNETGLTSVSFGKNLVTIGYASFALANLTTVEIPNSVIYISDFSFSDNPIESVIIGSSVAGVGGYAFYECDKLSSVTVLAENPPLIHRNTFPDMTYLTGTLTVLEESEAAYKADDIWKLFTNVDVTTGIEDLPADMGPDEGRTPIGSFGLDGRPVDDSYHGIVITRYSDGTTTKGLRR